MSVVPISRGFATLLVVFIVSLIACRPYAGTPVVTGPGSSSNVTNVETRVPNKKAFCDQGNFSKRSPLICVDPQNPAAPDPTPAIVWDLEDDSSGKPTNRPVTIVWQARMNVTLGIEFKDKSCVSNVRCNGPVCLAQVNTLNVPPEIRKNKPADPTPYIKNCAYELNLNGTVIDPDLEVNPCCW